mmetsp:Transcript_60430/g.129584  ORF Transcript_60430/g.129584 Transcript_60430/m.129584 type:complete len:223 (+) Transcript_60430:740-1408(+)
MQASSKSCLWIRELRSRSKNSKAVINSLSVSGCNFSRPATHSNHERAISLFCWYVSFILKRTQTGKWSEGCLALGMTSPSGSFGTGSTSTTSSRVGMNCTTSILHCRALVTDVGPVGTSLAFHRNLWMGLPLICQTVRAIPRISPKCLAFKSPSRITGASTAPLDSEKSVSASMIWLTWRTRIAVCARLSGSFARCVDTTMRGVLQARHLSSTMRQLLSRCA